MLRAIVQFLVTAGGLWLASRLMDGVVFSATSSLLWAAFLLGIVNTLVRPVLVFLTLPLTVVTLGLFLLVVNAATIGLVATLLDGFVLSGFWAGIGTAVVTGLCSWVAGALIGDRSDKD